MFEEAATEDPACKSIFVESDIQTMKLLQKQDPAC